MPRVDKWLWSVRIYKSRTKATASAKSGNIRINDKSAKPSSDVNIDDVVSVKKNGFNLIFKVVKPITKRVGAPIAIECYENLTPAEELNKFKDWFIGKMKGEFRERGSGRPTKRERRDIEDFKTDQYLEFIDIDDD